MVEYLFLASTFQGPIDIEGLLAFVKSEQPEAKTIALYATTQYMGYFKQVSEALEEAGYTVVSSKPKRCFNVGQILGCNSYFDSLNLDKEFDCFLFLVEGIFHTLALSLASTKPLLTYDIRRKEMKTFDRTEAERIEKKIKGNLGKFYMSDVIGVFISKKPGQSFPKMAKELETAHPDKTIYYFIGDNFNDMELDNFPFVQCWVNTACPRIGQEDTLRCPKPLINLKDILEHNGA